MKAKTPKSRRLVSLLLVLVMIVGLLPATTVYAEDTISSSEEAIEWLESKVGTTVGSGQYAGQCVALIQAYYAKIGVEAVSGDAKDYATNALPAGWERVQGGVPQKGDILVYTGGIYGHIVIYAGNNTVYHQNWNALKVEKTTSWSYDKSWYSSTEGGTKSYWGYIRPNFSDAYRENAGIHDVTSTSFTFDMDVYNTEYVHFILSANGKQGTISLRPKNNHVTYTITPSKLLGTDCGGIIHLDTKLMDAKGRSRMYSDETYGDNVGSITLIDGDVHENLIIPYSPGYDEIITGDKQIAATVASSQVTSAYAIVKNANGNGLRIKLSTSVDNDYHQTNISGTLSCNLLSSNNDYSYYVVVGYSSGTSQASRVVNFKTGKLPQLSGNGSGGADVSVLGPDYILHIDSPSGAVSGSDNVEVSGWIASNKQLTYCMAESTALAGGQANYTDSLTDASAELDAAGYSSYTYKYRYHGVISKTNLASNSSYGFKVWFGFVDGSASTPIESSFTTGTVENTQIVITCPASNYAAADKVTVTGYVISNNPISYVLGEIRSENNSMQFAPEVVDDAPLAAEKGYAYAKSFSAEINAAVMKTSNVTSSSGNYTCVCWTGDQNNNITTVSSSFPLGNMTYGDVNDYVMHVDEPIDVTVSGSQNISLTGWVVAQCPVCDVMFQVETTDGQCIYQNTAGMIDYTGDLNSSYAGYTYRKRYVGVVESSYLESNKEYRLRVWCDIADSSGNGHHSEYSALSTIRTGTLYRASYTVNFHTNDGNDQIAYAWPTTWVANKLHEYRTIPAVEITRQGYDFCGWSTTPDGQVEYLPGAQYDINENDDLYAVWKESGVIAANNATYSSDETITLNYGYSSYWFVPDTTSTYRFKVSGNGAANFAIYKSDGTIVSAYNNRNETDSSLSADKDLIAGEKYWIKCFTEDGSAGSFVFSFTKQLTVSYDANGGTGGANGTETFFAGETYQISDDIPTKQYKITVIPVDEEHESLGDSSVYYVDAEFFGWQAKPFEYFTLYQAGETYTKNSSAELSAYWLSASLGTIQAPEIDGHTFDTFEDESGNIVTSATSVTEDTTIYAVSGHNHTWDDGVITTEASCTTDGEILYTCSECKETKTEIIPATGHKLVNGVCSNCGATIRSGYSGSTKWTLDCSNGVFTVSGNGSMKKYNSYTEVPWYNYKDEITALVVDDGVTRISACSFYGCTNLQTVTLPDTVIEIADYAFKGCTSLESIDMPEKMSRIGASSFYGCSSLKSIVIPEGVYTIWAYAFKNCTALENITFPSTMYKIDTVAFYGCTSLTEVYLPDKVATIGIYAFKNCTALKSIHLPASISEIREAAFYATALTEVVIPDKVTKIGTYAFKNCSNLKSVTLSENLQSIGSSAFYGCDLNTLTIPDSVTTIGGYAFRGNRNLTDVSFSDNLTTIGDAAFYYCTSLQNVTLSDKVTEIGSYAFKNCTKLQSVTLSENLQTIGDSAFYACSSLAEIEIPSTVTSIGGYCFARASALKDVWFNGNAPKFGSSVLSGTEATIHYPSDDDTWYDIVGTSTGGLTLWNDYSVLTFDANGGTTPIDSKRLSLGEAYGTLPVPEREHYTFNGWFTDDGDYVDEKTLMGSKNVTLIAHWSKETFFVSWDEPSNGTITVTRTSSVISPSAPIGVIENGSAIYYGDELEITYTAAAHYTITSKGDEQITVTGNVTSQDIYLQTQIDTVTYQVQYVTDSGALLGSGSITKNFGSTETIYAPEYSGYGIPNAITVKFNTYTAKTIVFVYRAQKIMTSSPFVGCMETIEICDDCVHITGWAYNTNNTSQQLTIIAENYNHNGSGITYIPRTVNGITGNFGFDFTITGTSAGKLRLIAIGGDTQRYISGYTDFAGVHTIAYNSNGGSGAPTSTQSVGPWNEEYGAVYARISYTEPVREGYTFIGWSTSANGCVQYLPGSTYCANSDVTLYAVWEQNS